VSPNKIYVVAALGLSDTERRFIKIMLALTAHASTFRVQGRYEWSDGLSNADIVIVNAADDDAMQAWYQLAESKSPPVILLVTATEGVPFAKYHFSRPFGPAKVLMWLDKIVSDKRSHIPQVQLFSSDDKLAHREYFVSNQEVVPERHRALVVDDSPTVRKQLVLELGSFNIKVDTAENGEQGLEMLRLTRYDIIFLDVVMPGTDGYQVCKMIRRNQETKLIPVVMLTSKSSPFDKVRGSLAGCSSYLTKPVGYENFYQVLEGYLALTKNDTVHGKKLA
jgi:two-component system, cell cycle response regulator